MKMDCRYFYGESFVFSSCTILSVDVHGNISVLIKINSKTRQLNTDILFCNESSICLTFDKVCNLVDDCSGDGSDESMCDNHFKCETSWEYITLNQKYDQIFHCVNCSDECNDSCGVLRN